MATGRPCAPTRRIGLNFHGNVLVHGNSRGFHLGNTWGEFVGGRIHLETRARPSIEEQDFGQMPDGTPVKRFTLRNPRVSRLR